MTDHRKKCTGHPPGYALPEDAAETIQLPRQLPRQPTKQLPGQVQESFLPITASSRFEEMGIIGKGGMSTVKRVYDRLFLRQVARKELKQPASRRNQTRFFEEAQILSQLNHPNIIPVHDIELDDGGRPFRFTMKLVEGQTLRDALKEEGSEHVIGKNIRSWLRVFLKICDAISFAHSHGVLHCDLKPGNVMVGTHGQVYVMDWGTAHLIKEKQSISPTQTVRVGHESTCSEAPGVFSGTPAYMAPEQALREIEKIDERTDVFGLGGFLYFMLTFRAPYVGSSVREVLALAAQGGVQDPQSVVKDRELPVDLCRITMRALSPEKKSRYQTVGELINEIEDFLRGGGWFATKHLSKGTVIVREGEKADAAYIIASGTCEVRKTFDHKPQLICRMGEGRVFGETAIFGSLTRTATVTAASDVSLVVVTREILERELGRNEWLGLFVKAITQRLLAADEKYSVLNPN